MDKAPLPVGGAEGGHFARKLLALALPLLLLLTACEEETTLDIKCNGGDCERVAIDARLWDSYGDSIPFNARVIVSRSTGLFSDTPPVFIPNATVVIYDNVNQRDTLQFFAVPDSLKPPIRGFGGYVSNNLVVYPHRIYTCEVTVDGVTYKATNFQPDTVRLDSLSLVHHKKEGFYEEGWYVKLNGQEPPGKGNYYLGRYWKNDTLQTLPTDIALSDDQFVDGNYIDGELFYKFNPGDSIRVEFHATNQAVYNYYYAWTLVMQGTGGPFSGPGANPPSNFNHDALGLFWVSMPQRLSIRVPK